MPEKMERKIIKKGKKKMKRLQINTLEKGWQEWDELMLHACFQILVDYWEKDHLSHVEACKKIDVEIIKISGDVPDITQSKTLMR